MKRSVVFLALIFASSACVTHTQDPYTGNKKASNQLTGSALGAVAGAVLGNQVKGGKHTRRNARIAGALLGGLVGNQVGGYMDNQEQELRQKLQSTGVGVERAGDEIILVMPSNITFSSGQSTIRNDFYPVLGSVAKVLKEYKETQVEVRGHTDSRGGSTDNQVLSEQRANIVAGYLRTKGVAQKRLITLGLGESSPIASNSTTTGRAQNRRVEIKLIPLSH